MPGERRSRRGRASRRMARRPQYASETLAWNMRLIIPVMSGLPIHRCVHGIAPRVDAALEPRAEHHVGAVLELADELGDRPEVVRLVGVAHHDVPPAGGGEAGEVGVPVAALRLGDDARSLAFRDLGGAVGRAVVDDHDLAGEPRSLDALPRALDDGADRLFLVEAGNHHCDVDLCRWLHGRGPTRPTCTSVGGWPSHAVRIMGRRGLAPKSARKHMGARCDRPAASRPRADLDRRLRRRRPGARRPAVARGRPPSSRCSWHSPSAPSAGAGSCARPACGGRTGPCSALRWQAPSPRTSSPATSVETQPGPG